MPEAGHIRTTSRVPSKPKRQAATPFDTKLLELGKRFGKMTRAIDAGWDQPEDERTKWIAHSKASTAASGLFRGVKKHAGRAVFEDRKIPNDWGPRPAPEHCAPKPPTVTHRR